MDENEHNILRADEPPPAPIVETPPETAKSRLRAFEDETLGEDAVRISGQIEKGHGSFFKTKLTDKQRKHHAALERLVGAEEKLAHASASLAGAEAAHEAAKTEVAASESSADGDDQPE